MTKSDSEVIEQFNEYVNMTADDLEEWLKSDPSTSSGWSKEDGSGETVGHDSGRKIVEILKANPNKDSSKYTEEQLSHMHKVVAYCARHLAQESHMKEEKSEDELRETKSYKSLKNWGHDSLKKDGSKSGSGSAEKKKADDKDEDDEEKEAAPSKGKGKGKASKEEVQEDERREEANKADQESGEEGDIVSGKRKRKERAISADEVQEDPEYNSEEDDDFAPGDDDDEEEEGEGDDDDEDEDDEEDDDDDEEDGPAQKKARTD